MVKKPPSARCSRTPGDLILHPVSVTALLAVIVNDRVLKTGYPSMLSGKLSDFAGLVFFPLFLVAAVEAARWVVIRSRWQLPPAAVVATAAAVGVAFTLIKLWAPAGDTYRVGLGAVYWVFEVPASLLRGDGYGTRVAVNLVEDPWDLLALPMLILPCWVAYRVMRPPPVALPVT